MWLVFSASPIELTFRIFSFKDCKRIANVTRIHQRICPSALRLPSVYIRPLSFCLPLLLLSFIIHSGFSPPNTILERERESWFETSQNFRLMHFKDIMNTMNIRYSYNAFEATVFKATCGQD